MSATLPNILAKMVAITVALDIGAGEETEFRVNNGSIHRIYRGTE